MANKFNAHGGDRLDPTDGSLDLVGKTTSAVNLLGNSAVITDAAGRLQTTALNSFAVGGATTQIQFNDAGVFAGDSRLTFNPFNGQTEIGPVKFPFNGNVQGMIGLDVNGFFDIDLVSAANASDAVHIEASHAAGGIELVGNAGGIAIQATGASIVKTSGAGVDQTISSEGGRVVIFGGKGAADTILLTAGDPAGGITMLSGTGGNTMTTTGKASLSTSGVAQDAELLSSAGRAVVTSSQAAADAVRIHASHTDGGVDIDSGTAGTIIATTGKASLSTTGVGQDAELFSIAGRAVMTSGQAAADAVHLNAFHAAGGINMDSGTAGTTIDSTGAISVDAAAASNFTVTGAGVDMTIGSTAGRVVIDGGEAVADAVNIDASHANGGITMTSGTGGTTIASTVGPISLTTSQFGVDSVHIESTNGGVDFATGTHGIAFPKGNVTQTTNINTTVIVHATTGVITTVSAATAGSDADIFTVTNNRCSATSLVLANLVDYAGTFNTDGLPVIQVDNITASAFDIVIINADNATALDGILKIGFMVLREPV